MMTDKKSYGWESSMDEVDSALESFLTHLKRMNIVFRNMLVATEERNFLMLPILPHIAPEYREKLELNSDSYGMSITDMQEVFMLMVEDIDNLGNGWKRYIEYIEAIIESKDENGERG